MSDEQDKLKVSLEPPKLFGRKKKSDAPASKRTPSAPAGPGPSEPEDADESVEEPEPTADVVEEAPAEETPAEESPAEDAPTATETHPEAAVTEPDAETTVIEPATEEPATEEPADDTAVLDTTAEAAPRKAPQKPTRPAPAKKTARPRAKLAPPIEPEPVKDTDLEDAAITASNDDDGGPLLDMYPAAAVTGVVVGGVMVLLTWLSLRGCEAVRGTSSCGGGPGFVLLVATFVLCILLGSTLLKTFSIPDPGSSSFLAVGLVAVVALLFLIDALDNWSMIIVIPVLAVGAYLASVWVTKTFVEPTDVDST